MVSLPSLHSSQVPIPAQYGSPSGTLLDRELPTNGGVKSLLMEVRRMDPALYEHSLLVWVLTRHLLASLGYPREEQATIARAALMHDVGKLTLPRSLLGKPTRLSPQEDALMQQHPAAGARLLWQSGVAERITLLVYHHHERWDGQGYPVRLTGLAIPRGARLIALVDAFAAMTASRPYQAARSMPDALLELGRCAGTQFDPLLVRQCLPLLQAMPTGAGARCQ